MSNDTIKISQETKDTLDEIKENHYKYTTLSYSEAVDVVVAEYEGETSGSSGVTRTFDGGENPADDTSEDDNDSMTAEERAAQFRQ